MKMCSVLYAVAVITGGLVSKAGEVAFSFSPPSLPQTSGVVARHEPKVTMVSTPSQTPKLMLALNPIPKSVNVGEPKLLATSAPTTPSTNSMLLDRKILELPEKTPFPNLHYVHREWRIGDGLGSEDSFGRLWKLSNKSDLVFPYFKWENPTRKEERVLVGVFWSRRF